MPTPPKKIRPKKATAAKTRSWRVSILRQRAKVLGDVQAPDEKAAEAEAVAEFNLSDEQRKRLVVQERGLGGCPAFLLNIEKRSLPRLMLSGDGLASNDAV